MPYYATLDYDNECISKDAHIEKFQTLDEAVRYLTARVYLAENERLVIEECDRYGDCWVKLRKKPRVGASYLKPFSYTQLHIQAPGTHPGGKAYWITPLPPVYVARLVWH